MPEVRFGAEADFALGVEEELLLVDATTLALAHDAVRVLDAARAGHDPAAGAIGPDTYAALVELASPVVVSAAEGLERIAAVTKMWAAGVAAPAGI